MAGNEKLNIARIGEESTARVNPAAPSPPGFENTKKRADLVTLFRLLMRQPAADHDFRSCPICKRYGILEI
jgi:hypothetical protein